MYSSYNFGRTASVSAIRFEDMFCTSKKRWDSGRWVGIVMITCCAHDSCLGWLLRRLGQHWLSYIFLSWKPLRKFHFWHYRQFSVRRSVHSSESPDHCKLANDKGVAEVSIERVLENETQCIYNGLTIAAIVSALNRGIHCWGYVSHCLYQQVEQEGA